MSGLMPLVLLWLASKGGGGSSAPKWPGRKHPPPGHIRAARHGHNPPSPASPAPPAPMDATSHAPPMASVSKEILVADAQRIAIARGAALKPDGLYGPKTAAAWAHLAAAQGLPAEFTRVGPRTATVDAHTYSVLASGAMNPKSMVKAQAKRMLSSFGGKILSGVYIP